MRLNDFGLVTVKIKTRNMDDIIREFELQHLHADIALLRNNFTEETFRLYMDGHDRDLRDVVMNELVGRFGFTREAAMIICEANDRVFINNN
jgi:hypothetical protein